MLLKWMKWLTVFEWADLDSRGIHHRRPALWLIMIIDHYWKFCLFRGILLQKQISRTLKSRSVSFTSMQRQGRGREYGNVALFTGSSFFIWNMRTALNVISGAMILGDSYVTLFTGHIFHQTLKEASRKSCEMKPSLFSAHGHTALSWLS